MDTNFSFGLTEFKIVQEDWNLTWNSATYQNHYHRLYFLRNGMGRILLKDDKTLTLEPGRIYLVPANFIRQTTCVERMEQFFIHFLSDQILFNTILEVNGIQSSPANGMTEELFRRVIENAGSGDAHAQFGSYGAFLLLLSECTVGLDLGDPDVLEFGDTIKYIETHYTGELTLDELAAQAGYSPVYFSNKFKKALGIAPQLFITAKRLQFAQMLLTQNDLSVKEISRMAGFENESYFIKRFKKEYHRTPGDYRRDSLRKE